MKACSVRDCPNVVNARGLCSKHYHRELRHGSPDDSVLKFGPKPVNTGPYCLCETPNPRHLGGFDAWQCDKCGKKLLTEGVSNG